MCIFIRIYIYIYIYIYTYMHIYNIHAHMYTQGFELYGALRMGLNEDEAEFLVNPEGLTDEEEGVCRLSENLHK